MSTYRRGLAAHDAAAWEIEQEQQLDAATRLAMATIPERPTHLRERRRRELAPTLGRLLDHVHDQVGDVTFATWLHELTLEDATADRLWLGAPPQIRTWVRERFTRLLEQAATRLADRPIAVAIVPAPPPAAPTREEPSNGRPF
jgi:hypothetical protein